MSAGYYEEELTRISNLFTNLLTIPGQTTPEVPGETGSLIVTPTQQDYELAIGGYQSMIELAEPQHQQILTTLKDYRDIIDE